MIDRRNLGDRRHGFDRRDRTRHPLTAELRFLRAGADPAQVLQGELLDVSATGIRISLDQQLKAGENLLVEMRGPDQRCLNLTAQVVWSEPAPEAGHRVGCELRMEMSRSQRNLLRTLIGETAPETGRSRSRE